MTRSRTAKNILLGCVYLTLFVGLLYFVLPPRLFLNHDGFRKIGPGMRLWEVEWLLGGPPGAYYPTYEGSHRTRIGMLGPAHEDAEPTKITRVWYDDESDIRVGFSEDGRVTYKFRSRWHSEPYRLLGLIHAFRNWIFVGVVLLLISRVVWNPRRLDHEGFDRIQPGMTHKQVRHLFGGPPGVYYPTYEGARTRCSGPAYDGPVGTLALDWWDNKERYTVYFDDKGRVVGKHSPDEWYSTAYTCRFAAMLFGTREPSPLPTRMERFRADA